MIKVVVDAFRVIICNLINLFNLNIYFNSKNNNTTNQYICNNIKQTCF